MLHILPIFHYIKDEIAIFTPSYTHFLHFLDTSEFCRELRANPPYGGEQVPPIPKSVRLTLGMVGDCCWDCG